MANRKIRAELDIDGKDNTSPAFRSVATRIGGVEKQIAGFNRVAKDLGKTTSEVNRRLRDIEKSSQQVARRSGATARATREAFGTVARYAAPAIIAAGAKKALTDFAAVEREMNRIGITAEATGDETAAAFTQLQTMSKQMALPIQQSITALDTLVSSGMNLKEAMAFLPSVLATAQASGAATEDIANTALKASSALKIQAGDMQHAFDIMVTGGKAGQFELKDMAMYIPDLANSFASLGYTGEQGLKQLIAILQTVREDTGTAADAAVYVQNIFGKMNSQETVKNFKKFGVDLNAEMEKAKKNGEDVIHAFVRLANEATKGDLSKLPRLFNDQQMRLGMQSLMTSADSYERFIKAVNGTNVDGTVFRDLNRVLGDTQASVDRLQSSWDKMWNSIGKSVSRPAVPVMDAISSNLDYGEAVNQGLQKKGMGWFARTDWFARHAPYGQLMQSDEADDIAYDQGFGDEVWRNNYQKRRYERGVNKPSVGRQSMPVVVPEFPGGDRHLSPYNLPQSDVPTPMSRPIPDLGSPTFAAEPRFVPPQYRGGSAATPDDAGRAAALDSFLNSPITKGAADLKQSADEAGKSVADASRQAGDSLKNGGDNAASSILAAARALQNILVQLSNLNIKVQNASSAGGAIGQMGGRGVNADTGKSNTFATMPPGGNSGGGGGF